MILLRLIYDAEDELMMHKIDKLWMNGLITEIEIFIYISTPIFIIH